MFAGYKFEGCSSGMGIRDGKAKNLEKKVRQEVQQRDGGRVKSPRCKTGTRGTPPLVGHGSLGRDSMIFWIQSGGGCFEQRRLLKNANLRKSFEPPNVQVPQGPPCSARRFTIWRTVRFWYVTVHGSGGYGSSPLICICATCSPGGPNWRLMASSPSSTSVAFFNSNLWSLRFRRSEEHTSELQS